MTRAKFICTKVTEFSGGGGEVYLVPFYSTDPNHENKAFWDATPSGSIHLQINNPSGFAHFQEGKEYYVDFSKCHEQP